MTDSIIGIKELHKNLKRVADAAQKGASYTVVRDSKPVFRIEPALPFVFRRTVRASKSGTYKDFLALAVKTGDRHLSRKVDEIVYGSRRRR